MAAIKPSGSESNVEEETADRAVKRGNKELEELRRRCKNTLYVCAAILCRDNLQSIIRLLYTFLTPLWTAHSDNARRIRAPEDALAFYVEQSKFGFMQPLEDTISLLHDPLTLRHVGFTMTFSLFKKAALSDTLAAQLDAEDSLAKQAVELVVHLVRFRCSSMSWHSSTWPGLLALFASDDPGDRQSALTQLSTDWKAFKDAKSIGASLLVYRSCAPSPPSPHQSWRRSHTSRSRETTWIRWRSFRAWPRSVSLSSADGDRRRSWRAR